MPEAKADVAIVGAGIIGLAHAYLAARAGLKVIVFERNPAASGASIRNFGMIWPIGQAAGAMYRLALRSREIWLEILQAAGLPYFPSGSLHAAYREDEAMVGQEFAGRAPGLGYACAWLNAAEASRRSGALRTEGLLGALWSPSELTVDPRLTLRQLPVFLSEKYGVEFYFNTAVQAVDPPRLRSGQRSWQADAIIVAAGDDFQTLFPEHFAQLGLTRCKLQMMRTVPQPADWRLGPSLAFGLTFRHYPAFEICESLESLRARIARETPEFDRWGIHVMVSQTAEGELTIGDSHEYFLDLDIFDRPQVNRLILDYARKYLRVPSLELAQTWHGSYAKHAEKPFIRFTPAPGVEAVTVTSGIGMTLSFGLAEKTMECIGAGR